MADFFAAKGPTDWIRRIQQLFENSATDRTLFRAEAGDEPSHLFGFEPRRQPWPGGHFQTPDLSGVWLGDVSKIASSLDGGDDDADAVTRELETWCRDHDLTDADEIRGPLAAVTFDGQSGSLECIRDKLGRIPLQYFHDGKRLFITSYSDWLLKITDDLSVDQDRLKHLLVRQDPGGRHDFLKDVYRVFPREHLEWTESSPDSPSSTRYWTPSTTIPDRIGPLQSEFSDRLHDALSFVDDSNVDESALFVGMSGGLDSPFLADLLHRNYFQSPHVNTSSRVCRVSEVYDERHDIVRIGEYLPVEHHLFDVSDFWPLRDVSLYRRYPGDGPVLPANVSQLTKFHAWNRRQLGAEGLVLGSGAELCTSFPSKAFALRNWINQDGAAHVWRNSERQHRELLTDLTKIGLHHLRSTGQASNPMVQWISDRVGSRRPWREPNSWLRFEIQHHDWYANWWKSTTPGAAKLGFLDSMTWETVTRQWNRYKRHVDLTFFRPYLDERVIESGFHVPWKYTFDKRFLKEVARDSLPSAILEQSRVQHTAPTIAESVALKEYDTINDMFSSSKLDQLGLISSDAFRETLQAFSSAVEERGFDEVHSVGRLWQTIAVENWLHALS